jgi:AcrR family transcriptional regulator
LTTTTSCASRSINSGARGCGHVALDIARDAGVQRGSLYNAFGSKEALFLCAYERYASDYLSALQKTLGAGTLRERLTAFFELAIKNFRSGSPPRGCPTTRGLMELTSVEGEGLDETRAKPSRIWWRASPVACRKLGPRVLREASSRETPRALHYTSSP